MLPAIRRANAYYAQLGSMSFLGQTAHGLHPRPSDAPFVLVDGAAGLRDRLAPLGIVVRDCTSFGLPDCARIAVPDPDGLERLNRALEAVAAEEVPA